jgi:hypothetical protein
LWIHTSNPEKFKHGYDVTAKEINIPSAEDPATSKLDLVKAWLTEQDCGQWLMIDNADDGSKCFGPSAAKY